MKVLGYRYDENKRSYFTDGHERDDVVKYRNDVFLNEYFESELRCYRWVTVTKTTEIQFKEDIEDVPTNCSFDYTSLVDGEDIEYREYHSDSHPVLIKYVSIEGKKYGGDLSERRDKTLPPLMILGQDESTFHQYIFAKRSWKNISGYNQIVPKSVGDLLMISGYQSRETGLGLGNYLDDEVLR